MNARITKWVAAAGAATALTLGAGCASIEDMETLQAEVDSLRGELAAAQDAAAAAASEAQAARAEADEAAGAAGSAMSAASEAQASGAANSEKIDRMFEKMMMKGK